MQVFSCAEVMVDKCAQCQGIWFDARELGIFRDTLQGSDLTGLKVVDTPSRTAPAEADGIRACPRDGNVLVAFNYSYSSNVRLHRCDQCHGIWSPFSEIIHLAAVVKVSQAIEPDVRGLGKELLKHHAFIQRWRSVESLGKLARTPMHGYFSTYGHPVGIVLPLGTDRGIGWSFPIVMIAVANAFIYLPASPFLYFLSFAFLWIFGFAVERLEGWIWLTVIYGFSGIATSVLVLFGDPGASTLALATGGAISGLLGAYFGFLPARLTLTTFIGRALVRVPAWIFLGTWYFAQIFFGHSLRGDNEDIVFYAPVIGFAAGFFLALARRMNWA